MIRQFINPSITASLLLLSCFTSPFLFADIKDFNAAMRQGDYKAAAKETQSIWQEYDKSKPSAPTLAREFAFVNYMAEEFDTADKFINELTKRVVQDDQREVTAVLEAAIDYRRSDRVKYLDRLTDALERRLSVDGVDNISVLGADLVYMGYWNHRQWDDVPTSAAIAKKLYERGGEALKVRMHRADIFATAAKHMDDTQRPQYHTMSDIHDAIVADIDRSEPGKQRDELVELKFQAQAWSQAIYATYLSYNPGGASRLKKAGRKRELHEPSVDMFSDQGQRVINEPCDVKLVARKLRYPKVAGFSGMVGSVIARLHFDEQGKVTDSELMASVPAGIFAETVMSSAPEFYLERLDDSAPGCQFPASELQAFTFIIQ